MVRTLRLRCVSVGIIVAAFAGVVVPAFAESVPSDQSLADIALRHATPVTIDGSLTTFPGIAVSLEKEVSQDLPNGDNLDLYAGLPGTPALGPDVDSPWILDIDELETQHSQGWLDQGFFAHGVVTAGFSHDDQQVEISRFDGQSDDRLFYGLPGRPPYTLSRLDSTSLRYTWNMDSNWTLQASWGSLQSPEDFAPGMSEDRWTTSAQYSLPIGRGGSLSVMLAWGVRRENNGENLQAAAFDVELQPFDQWKIFVHSDLEQDNKLLADDALAPGQFRNGGTVSIGTMHSWTLLEQVTLAAGGLYTFDMMRDPEGVPIAGPRGGAVAYIRLVAR